MKQSKDIPNEDFECNPKGDCWCKEIEFPPLSYSKFINSDICYSPREVKLITKKGKNYSFSGTLDTNYTFFNLNPPKLGIFAEVFNNIKIVANLQSDQIRGFEKVINLEY